ncbi:MAG: TolC family protein [Rhodocyclales bacterium]|nr:TolC family protein [Rhodocyclales bacterium]
MVSLTRWRWLPFLTTIAVSSAPTLAAEPYTLDHLIALARGHNASILASYDQIEAARAGITSARAFPNPELEYTRGDFRVRLPGAITGDAKGVWLTQRLEYPHQRGARIDAAKAGFEATEAEVRGFQALVIAQLKTRFYDLLRRQAEAKAAQEDFALMEQIRKRVAVRVETGEAPRYELIKAEAETLNAQKSSQSAALRVNQARAALRLLAGSSVPENFDVRGELEHTSTVPPLDVLRREIEERNPDLARARAAARRAEQQLAHERSLRLPTVALRAGYDQDPEVRNQRVGVVVSIPIFDRRSGPVAEAAAQFSRARHERDYQEFALMQALEAAWQQYQIALAQVTAFESGILRQAEAALKVAEAAYRFGERGILDYLDAQRVYRAARNELIAARHDLQLAAIEIERLRAAPESIQP